MMKYFWIIMVYGAAGLASAYTHGRSNLYLRSRDLNQAIRPRQVRSNYQPLARREQKSWRKATPIFPKGRDSSSVGRSSMSSIGSSRASSYSSGSSLKSSVGKKTAIPPYEDGKVEVQHGIQEVSKKAAKQSPAMSPIKTGLPAAVAGGGQASPKKSGGMRSWFSSKKSSASSSPPSSPSSQSSSSSSLSSSSSGGGVKGFFGKFKRPGKASSVSGSDTSSISDKIETGSSSPQKRPLQYPIGGGEYVM